MTLVLREARTLLTVFLMNLAARLDAESFAACCEAVCIAVSVAEHNAQVDHHTYDPDSRRN